MLDLDLAAPQRYRTLTIFPLVTPTPAELPYRLLAEALAAGTLAITELGAGTVPAVLAKNRGDEDVLILDGEQLIGARQNRTVNRTILLAARTETEIPVSCMEQGRWRPVSDAFAPAPQHSPALLRKHARLVEAARAEEGGGPAPGVLAAAQHAVWREIDAYSAKLRVRSPTGALDELYRARAADLDAAARAFPRVPGQVGLLAFIGARPLGLDAIGGRALYARLHDRLLRGYLMDGLAGPEPASAPPEPDFLQAAAEAFLDDARSARRGEAPTVGRGTYRVLAGPVVGGELVDGDRLAHLSAFPPDDRPVRSYAAPGAAEPPIAPPSWRRR